MSADAPRDAATCQSCGAVLPARAGRSLCSRCGTPHARHDFSPDQFPLTIQIFSGTTGEVVWSRTVTIDEARDLAKIEIPSFVGSPHYPVRAEITCADDASEDGGTA